MKKTKLSLFYSVVSLVLCASMLVGTTFAWFTDGVSTGRNTIAAGNLDVALDYLDAQGNWQSVDENTELFDDAALWEPGYTEVVYLRVRNQGSLALKYQLGVNILSETGSVNVNGDDFRLSDYIEFAAIEGVESRYADREAARSAVTNASILSAGYTKRGSMEAGEAPEFVALVVYMPETVGNDANHVTGVAAPSIKLGVELVATQHTSETDSFGSDYDTLAYLEYMNGMWVASAPVVANNGAVSEALTVGNTVDIFTAEVPVGVKVVDGVSELELRVSTVAESAANVQLAAGQVGLSVDVHMEGVADDNTVPMAIHLGKIAPAGLYDSNIALYHVEDGATVSMTQVADIDALAAHNEFYYNAKTGEVTIMLATFSEVYAAVSEGNPWDGSVDTTWYNDADELTLYDAADLAGFAKLVAEGNTFEGKTVNLSANLNMGGDAVLKDGKLCFHPIGVDVSGDADTLSPFKGTFDGNGHTISNIFQNTWMLKGHYDAGYYNEAMGLFGMIDGGTVRDLVIDGMVAEGEFTDMGCITAYARGNCTFDNIRITNVSMYSYNCRTAGIVGYDWIGETGSNLVFSNIEIDPSCVFGALWGSWDVACAGILGYKNDASKTVFNNCEVGCELDVYNDVCGNYQYYQYRYAGMMIGTVGKDEDPSDQLANGNIVFNNSTVHYGDWVNYYYCEFEKNSLASYSEDYQFSRVPAEELVFDGNGNVIGCTHNHTAEEDKQAVYIPFKQILTGYGWGATAVTDGVSVKETKYTISYAYGNKVYDVTYITDNSKPVNPGNEKLEAWAESMLGGKYEFDYWMNAGSTKVETIVAGNTNNIVLYPSFAGIYIATFVDLNGNVITSDTYTKNSYSNIKGKNVTAPIIADCEFDYWEVRINKNGTVTKAKLSDYKFADNMDITIYPVYTYKGDINLKPHDTDGDGITDYYSVESASGLSGDVLVPGNVNGIPVTVITDLSSDWLNTQVTSIEIKEGVETIGANAFAATSGLKEVIVPLSVTSIGKNAFSSNWGSVISKNVTIKYAGTWEQWQAACNTATSTDTDWDSGLGNGAKVVCTDGTYVLDTNWLDSDHKWSDWKKQ